MGRHSPRVRMLCLDAAPSGSSVVAVGRHTAHVARATGAHHSSNAHDMPSFSASLGARQPQNHFRLVDCQQQEQLEWTRSTAFGTK